MSALHVVFDLDDTLYAERDYALCGFRSAAAWAERTLGVQVSVDRMTGLLDEGHLGQLFPRVLKDAKPDHSDDELKAFVRAYQVRSPDLSLFSDAAAILPMLAARHKLGLITDGHAQTQQTKVTALGISNHFAHIIYTGALGPNRSFHKPHPRAFELMAAELGRSPSDRYVYVGDNLTKDFVAPNGLGWTSIHVDRPAHRSLRIHKHQPVASGGAPHHSVETLH